MNTTYVLWKWNGWNPIYTAEHVNRTVRQLERNGGPARIVCVTDAPHGVQCETVPLVQDPEVHDVPSPNCYLRLGLFDCFREPLGERMVSVDIDGLIRPGFADLLTRDPFKAATHKYSRVCGTLWQLRAGAHPEVYSAFNPATSPDRVREHMRGKSGSDQGWMSLMLPNCPVWTEADGVYWIKSIGRRVPANARYIHCAGNIKPWSPDCKLIAPRVYEEYMDS